MAAPMEKTRHAGIYKRGSRYVAVWQDKGRQHKQAFRTLAEALEAKSNRQGGDRRPTTRRTLEDYAREWIRTYQGRTDRGFSATSRRDYGSLLKPRGCTSTRLTRARRLRPSKAANARQNRTGSRRGRRRYPRPKSSSRVTNSYPRRRKVGIISLRAEAVEGAFGAPTRCRTTIDPGLTPLMTPRTTREGSGWPTSPETTSHPSGCSPSGGYKAKVSTRLTPTRKTEESWPFSRNALDHRTRFDYLLALTRLGAYGLEPVARRLESSTRERVVLDFK